MTTYTAPNIIVGIPAYNEESRIGDVVRGALAHATTVVVVDDGSTDLTAFRALDAGAVVIRHTRNGGKGVAVAGLFRYAVEQQADALVLIDGDGQHDPAEIPAVVAPCLADRADLVVGSRFLSRRSDIPFHRTVGQRAFNAMTALASGVACSDSQSGFRAYNRRAICAMRITESSFSVESEQQFECLAHGLRLGEVPISCSYDLPEKRSAYVQGLDVLCRLGTMSMRRRLLRRSPIAQERFASTMISPTADLDPAVAMAAD